MEGSLQEWAGVKETQATEQMGHIWNLKVKERETKLEGEAVEKKSIFKIKKYVKSNILQWRVCFES